MKTGVVCFSFESTGRRSWLSLTVSKSHRKRPDPHYPKGCHMQSAVKDPTTLEMLVGVLSKEVVREVSARLELCNWGEGMRSILPIPERIAT